MPLQGVRRRVASGLLVLEVFQRRDVTGPDWGDAAIRTVAGRGDGFFGRDARRCSGG